MKKRTAWILVAGVAAVALGAAAVGALALLLRGQGRAAFGGENYLYLHLDGEVREEPSHQIETFFERRPPTLRTLVESFDRAALDPRVKAAVLRLSLLPDSGWGKLQELRDAIARFRKSGKPAYAHVEFAGNREYYLATACSKIYAVPTAILDVSGLKAEVTFFRKTLDKLGIEAQFEGIGRYKNAPNQFTESGFTEPHREQIEALLDSFFARYLDAIAAGRKKTLEETRALVDGGPYDAREALKAGLVDGLVYQDEVDERLKGAERITPGRYVRSARGFGLDGRPKVALVYVVGDIVPGESQEGPFGGEGFAGSDTVAAALREARTDGAIKAIVVRVDSPGGSGTASDVIWREVRLARKAKPVVISMGDLAASGGYYVASGADTIVAQPGTITGSIGVFGGKFALRGFYEKIGITKEILVRGKHAAIFSAYKPWTEEERDRMRSLMATFYDDFVGKVAEARKKSRGQVEEVAEGRVWTGAEAHERGLVDELGGMDVALALAKKKAGIPKEQDVNLVILPERKGLFETLLERREEGAAERAVPREIRGFLQWARLLGDGGLMARLPFELQVR